ncbi:MFS general substrate transporter [Teratosphaeria nubilosa]|uniref:MFS general substrate transporter n=1 Tax=Teratosphaeria nubilosa TaxID=161662 RepID=A0A6G1LK82_9PEZI|nr:MFS general substrate transporter [Teratosphaeria nubilosa]
MSATDSCIMDTTVRFLMMSDTHNFEIDTADDTCPLRQPMPKVDVVLHCGDLTQVGGTSAYKKALRLLGHFDADLKIVIADNHDISLDGEYWRSHLEEDDEPEEHDEAVAIMTGPLAKAAKVTYLTEGRYEFTLPSGKHFSIFVSPYQPECGDWAFGYKKYEDRWQIPEDVDIVMTHGPAKGVLDYGHNQHLGCQHLLSATERSRPLLHCFGHIHEGYGAETKHWDEIETDDGCAVGLSRVSQSGEPVMGLVKIQVGKLCAGRTQTSVLFPKVNYFTSVLRAVMILLDSLYAGFQSDQMAQSDKKQVADANTKGDEVIVDVNINDGPTPPGVKTTQDGIILVPQPSDDPDQPLNWSFLKKHLALAVLILETFFAKSTATFIGPAALTLAKDFHVTPIQATYIASATAIVPAIAPLIWIPLSQRLGRRPIMLTGTFLSMLFNIGFARSQTYAQALVCRLLGYAMASAGLCITPAAISDMFFAHEKGKRIGMNTFLLVVAPYLGGVMGGAMQYNPHLGWRWAMNIAAMIYAFLFLALLLFVPETIYYPNPTSSSTHTLYHRLGFRTPHPTERWSTTFARPYKMFAYPAIVLPSLWFSICYATEVANTAGFPLNFGQNSRFHFNTLQIGFCYFSGFVGASLAEWIAGPMCDLVTKRHLRERYEWHPEQLLKICWTGVVAIPTGLLVYGLELAHGTTWIAPLAGISIFAFGQEILVTVLLTYMIDAYPKQAAEVSIVFQFCMFVMAYHPPFYNQYWIEAMGSAEIPYIIWAMLPVIFFPFCIGLLMWKGREIRAKGPWAGRRRHHIEQQTEF